MIIDMLGTISPLFAKGDNVSTWFLNLQGISLLFGKTSLINFYLPDDLWR